MIYFVEAAEFLQDMYSNKCLYLKLNANGYWALFLEFEMTLPSLHLKFEI